MNNPNIDDYNAATEGARNFRGAAAGWDGDDAAPITESTWDRAVAFGAEFTRLFTTSAPRRGYIELGGPHISPCPDGSVDLLWGDMVCRDSDMLLVNVKADKTAATTYYAVAAPYSSLSGAPRNKEGAVSWPWELSTLLKGFWEDEGDHE